MGTGRVVLVTGVSRDLGRRFARAVAEDPSVQRVIGVDTVPPRGDAGAVSFVRADIRNPVIAKVIAKEDVDTVVHMSVISTPGSSGGRGTMKELNVIGTMQLLAACQKAPSVQRLVVKSTTTVYGASSRDPAMFTEDMQARRAPRSGYAKDVAEIEGYVRGFARRRPDVRTTILRCANVIGPHVVSPITSYFRLPVIPRVAGFDARLQFLHEDDLHDVLTHAVNTEVAGVFNVAGGGVLTLAQAVRRLQRPSVPMPGAAVGGVGSLLRSARLAEFSPEQTAFLTFGRGVDTTRMRSVLGFTPRYTSAEALADFARDLPVTGGRTDRALQRLADRLPGAQPGPGALPGADTDAAGRPDSTVDLTGALVGDAEIIPIGTRGKPGRGTGTRPSSASRSLAPARSTTPRKPAARASAPPADATSETSEIPVSSATEPAVAETPAVSADLPADRPGRVPTTTADRHPLGGVPLGELWAGFRSAATELFGDDAEQQLARFLAFLRRRITGDYVVDEYGFDAELTQRFLLAALRPVAQKWFRIEVVGAENIPTEGGALVVSNHSGTIPVDGLMTMVTVHDQTGRFLRPLGADLVFATPFVSSLARKSGTTLACTEDAERMLSGGELVGVWPEGFKGVGKPYSQRYKLQRFGRGGFVSAALRTGVPIVPLAVVGAEEIYPMIGSFPTLARMLGLPYLPITPFFPLLGPLGMVPLPSKWLLEFGEPIRTDDLDPGAADDPMLVFDVTDQVRETIQQTLYRLLMRRESVFG